MNKWLVVSAFLALFSIATFGLKQWMIPLFLLSGFMWLMYATMSDGDYIVLEPKRYRR